MARILRSTLPDGYFHVFTRGVADTAIFRDDEDRRSFLALLFRPPGGTAGSSTPSA